MSYILSLLMFSPCGTAPWAKPIYCSEGRYVCVCDYDSCEWQLVCE